MIRVALYFILVGAIAYGVALLADPPGDGAITWQGLRIETSLMVLGAAMLAAMLVLGLIISLIRSIARSPMVLARLLRNRRGTRAYEAISRGLIAVGAGDVAAAQRFTAQVQRLAPSAPLALLLTAHAPQPAGERRGPERPFPRKGGGAGREGVRLAGALHRGAPPRCRCGRARLCRRGGAYRSGFVMGRHRRSRSALPRRRLGGRAQPARATKIDAR